MAEQSEQEHPHEADDNVNHNIYTVSRQIDKILHRQPVADHAAILGMIQVTSQRRMHEHETRQRKEQMEDQLAAQDRQRLLQ